ncbi:MAG TPA: aminoglycoside 6'-N-acetyltransferase [Opitutaceae bacterium]|nr:aminoglycoside 6'-N-acetyltransferase [Opitutaceae bacterium]
MGIVIREASPADKDAWTGLRHTLWPDCPLERHLIEVEQLVSGDGMVALAWEGEETVGFAEISIRRDHVDGTSEAPVPYLEGWFVAAAHRGRGVGRALLEFAWDWARRKGFREMASDAELENSESIRAHARLGFDEVERTVHFVKRL